MKISERLADYIDPRAHKFLSHYFPSGWGWNSSCEAAPTPTVESDYGISVCAFCGRQSLPLQPYIKTHGDYTVKGATCVCKKAMDYHDVKEKIADLEKKQEAAMDKLVSKLPRPNKNVIKKVVQTRMKRVIGQIDRRDTFWDVDLKDTGVSLVGGEK